MQGLPGASHSQLGYRRITFVPVVDRASAAPPAGLVPLNDGVEAAMPGLRSPASNGGPAGAGSAKVQEFCKESAVVLSWTGGRRAVSA